MNQVAHKLGSEKFAEFVENDKILQECKRTGIDHDQGYGIAMPVSLTQVLDELELLTAGPAAPPDKPDRPDTLTRCPAGAVLAAARRAAGSLPALIRDTPIP